MKKDFKKYCIVIVSLCLCIVFLPSCGEFYAKDGQLLIGDGWQKTPEKAIEKQADNAMLNEYGDYDIIELLDIIYVDDKALVLYTAKSEALMLVTCVNNKDKWHFSGYSYERDLETPDAFVLNGDINQDFVIQFYSSEDLSRVFGFKYTSAPTVCVNGNPTQTKTYTFEIGDKTWSIDYWYIENVNVASKDDIKITYAE